MRMRARPPLAHFLARSVERLFPSTQTRLLGPPNIYESAAPVKCLLARIKSLLSREAFWSCSFEPRLSNPGRSRPAPDASHRTRDLRRDFAGNIYSPSGGHD